MLRSTDRPDLKREFIEASPDGGEHGDLLRSLRRHSGHIQGWDWLLASRIVVVLNEAGAGKTAELMDHARRLKGARRGFFLRIERICAQSFEEAFEHPSEFLAFQRWLRSKDEAVIFLDSVDEAKLPRDLDRNPLNLAIRRVESQISGQLHRTRLVISSRPSAWTTELELKEVERLAGVYRSRGIDKGDGEAPLQRFVSLAPLDEAQRQALAAWADAPTGFLDSLLSAGAVDFARTPLDLLDLAEAFEAEVTAGRNGAVIFESLSTMMDRAIVRRIAEAGADQPRSRLAPGRARIGARRLAAACVLAQQLTIQVPGGRGQGIVAAEALGDQDEEWSRPEIEQLLTNGLFTAAWEGSVRFQHRRTMERLAAEALDDLLRAGMPVGQMADVLMPKAFGETATPQAFVQTIGWLSTLNPEFRHHVLRHAPQLLMDTGDPGSHPPTIRDAALRGHVGRYIGQIWFGEWFDDAMLRRFAHPLLEQTCIDLLRSLTADEPRRLVLKLIEIAAFKDCRTEVRALVLRSDVDVDLRKRAVLTLSAIGEAEDFEHIRRAATRFRPAPSLDGHDREARNAFRLTCVAACRPDGMSLSEALGILIRLEPHDRQYLSTTSYELAPAIVDSCPSDKLPWLLRRLAKVCWLDDGRPFAASMVPRWSHPGFYLLPTLYALVTRAISERPDLHTNDLLIDQVDRLLAVGSHRRLLGQDDADGQVALLGAAQKAPDLQKAIFHVAAERFAEGAEAPSYTLRRLARRGFFDVSDEEETRELDWMGEDYLRADTDRHLRFLRDAIVDRLYDLSPKTRAVYIDRFVRLARINGDTLGQANFRRLRHRPIRKVWWSIRRLSEKHTWKRSARDFKAASKRWARLLKANLNRRKLRDGDPYLLWSTLFNDHFTDSPLPRVVEVYGRQVADDAAQGIKAYARGQEPGNGRNWTWTNHLAWIGWQQIALDDPDAIDALNADEAHRALSLAVHVNSFPAWATGLAERNTTIFLNLLRPIIVEEMSWRDGQLRYPFALSLLSRQAPSVQIEMADEILSMLAQGDADQAVITPATAVIATSVPLRTPLTAMVARRYRDCIASGQGRTAASWFSVWLMHAPEEAWKEFERFDRGFGPGSNDLLRGVLAYMGEGAPIQNASPPLIGRMLLDYMRLLPAREEDIPKEDHQGVGDAIRFRGGLPSVIARSATEEARAVLVGLSRHPDFAEKQSWIQNALRKQVEQAVAPPPWPALKTSLLLATFLKQPNSAKELLSLIERQIEAIVADLETSEFDRRGLFRDVQEQDVRAFFAEALHQRSQGWYSVTQETVTSREKRTDLRIESRTSTGEVVIVEIKLAGPSWSGDELVGHLTTQLVDQYLISRRVHHGVYLVVDLGLQKHWAMEDGAIETLDGLVQRMRVVARDLVSRDRIEEVRVLQVRIDAPGRKTRRKITATSTGSPTGGTS